MAIDSGDVAAQFRIRSEIDGTTVGVDGLEEFSVDVDIVFKLGCRDLTVVDTSSHCVPGNGFLCEDNIRRSQRRVEANP